MSVSYSTIEIQDIDVSNTEVILMQILYSSGTINGIKAVNISSSMMINVRQSLLTEFSNFEIKDIDVAEGHAVSILDSGIAELNNHTYENVNGVVFYILESIIDEISLLDVTLSMSAIFTQKSVIGNLTNSKISFCGNSEYLYSGGIYSSLSNITISS